MVLKYIINSITIAFSSWIVAMLVNSVLLKKESYKKITNLNFIKSPSINKLIGLNAFKWIVKNTAFKYFNENIKIKKRIGTAELNQLRLDMSYSEISHLIGFACVAIFALVVFIRGDFLFALIIMVVNILMNLYPSLLQQENKRRIDKLIKRFS